MSNSPPTPRSSLSHSGPSSSSPSNSFDSILGQLAGSHLATLIQGQPVMSRLSPTPVHQNPLWLRRERLPFMNAFLENVLNRNPEYQVGMPGQMGQRPLSVFVGLLPSNITPNEIRALLEPHQPEEIYLRPVGRAVNGQQRSIAAEVVFRTHEERQACLGEFQRLDLYTQRWPRPVRVEPFRSNQGTTRSTSTPEPRPETPVVPDPTPPPTEEGGILEALSDLNMRDSHLEKKRNNLRKRQKIQDERAQKRRTYQRLAEHVAQKLFAEQKTLSAHETTIRHSQKVIEFCKGRIRELDISANSLTDQFKLSMQALDAQTKQLVEEWRNLHISVESGAAAKIQSGAEFSVEPEIECVVCVEPMLGAIFQCHNGHCVCNTCFERMTHCGVCRLRLERPGIRCRLLETVVQKIVGNQRIFEIRSNSSRDSQGKS